FSLMVPLSRRDGGARRRVMALRRVAGGGRVIGRWRIVVGPRTVVSGIWIGRRRDGAERQGRDRGGGNDDRRSGLEGPEQRVAIVDRRVAIIGIRAVIPSPCGQDG